MTKHIMLDLETWGTEPGDDIRSIGAVVFDPVAGTIAMDFHSGSPTGPVPRNSEGSFHIACDNPRVGRGTVNHGVHEYYEPKYPLTRDPQTIQWWNDQSDEAQAAFADPVDLRDALIQFADWFDVATVTAETDQPQHRKHARLWCHGPSFDEPILRTAYRRLNLPVPWHYRAPRDTRTALELAGMDPHKSLEPFNTGTHHNALDDAICQARAVCEAYRRLRVPHDVVTHRSRWRHIIERVKEYTRDNDGNGFYTHELNAFDRTFETLANHPQLEK